MKTVFLDIDTQIDFLYPAGALYVRGAERLLPTFARLNRYAAAHGIVVVSTTDAHDENDAEFRVWPPHCVAGTQGQQKPLDTLLDKRVVLPAAARSYDTGGAQQVIVEKQHVDMFAEPNLGRLIERLNADRHVVYGVVTEYCVVSAAMGLLRMGKRVEIVTDAIQGLKEDDARRALGEFTAAGGGLVEWKAVSQQASAVGGFADR